MARGFDAAKFNREMRAAQRKAEAQLKREVDRVNRENQRRVDAYNRKVDQHNRKVVADYNRRVDRANAHNRTVIADLNRQLRAASSGPRYTADEQALADRVQYAIAQSDSREWDTFLSYARIDGAGIADELRRHLESLGVSVWFDAIAVAPGKSQALGSIVSRLKREKSDDRNASLKRRETLTPEPSTETVTSYVVPDRSSHSGLRHSAYA